MKLKRETQYSCSITNIYCGNKDSIEDCMLFCCSNDKRLSNWYRKCYKTILSQLKYIQCLRKDMTMLWALLTQHGAVLPS